MIPRLAAAVAALALACSGPAPTEPGRALVTSGTLTGRVVDQFTGAPVPGVRVAYQKAAAVTDADGRFTVSGTGGGARLRFAAASILNRSTYARAGDTVWKVVPAGFDTVAFNDISRSFTSRGTIRWDRAPHVYVDRRRHCFTGGDPVAWANEAAIWAAAAVRDWTAGTATPAVTVTGNPPDDFTPGTVVVHMSECATDYGGTAFIGIARLFWGRDNVIPAATVHVRFRKYANDPGKRRGILVHELGHTLGYRHMFAGVPSLMETSLGRKTDLLPFDHAAARWHYGRVAGNRHVDVDGRGTVGLALAGGGYWEGE